MAAGCLIAFNSCKKCYSCIKTDLEPSVISEAKEIPFDICNTNKEGNNGKDMASALADYEANGYVCTAK